MIKNNSWFGWVAADRLGSIGHFYPYGQEKPSATTNGTEKFTGYLRDGETGMDYAVNRYHVPGTGRFLTPDPYEATPTGAAMPTDPGTWNRYAYTRGDPVNFVDPVGTCEQRESVGVEHTEDDCNWPCIEPSNYCFGEPGGPGGGGGGSTQRGPGRHQKPNGINHATNYSTTSAKAVGVQNALRTLQAALQNDPTCGDWLTGNQGLIDTLVGNTQSGTVYVGVADFSDSTTNAVSGTGGTDLPSGALLTVALGGAYFTANNNTGYMGDITGGTPLAQVFILLHELAHLTNAADFSNCDGSNCPNGTANQNSNNQLVEQNCAKTLDLFGGKF